MSCVSQDDAVLPCVPHLLIINLFFQKSRKAEN